MIEGVIFVGLAVVAAGAFISGRKYERKQFVRVGKRKPTTQDILLGKQK